LTENTISILHAFTDPIQSGQFPMLTVQPLQQLWCSYQAIGDA